METLIDKVKSYSENCKTDLIDFLRKLISIPSISTKEEKVVEEIYKKMKELDYDEVFIDKMGNIIGKIGNGKIKLVYDSHIDTVDIGDRNQWEFDPFKGKFENGIIYGRGASDNKGGMASMVFGGYLLKKIGVPKDFSIYIVGTVQEEDCDGLALEYILTNEINNVFGVVLGECTDLNIYRGHRGRIELTITTKGKASHASAPERGINAIYKMAPIITDIEKLNFNLKTHPILGKGTIAVTFIESKTGSLNTIPDECKIFIDRRLTIGEDKNLALQELSSIVKDKGVINILNYEEVSWKGLKLKQEKYYPSWLLDDNHILVDTALQTQKAVLGYSTKPGCWIFSTNGVASMGKLKIPTIGFGPGKEEHSHSIFDQVKVSDLIKAVQFYVLLPHFLNSKIIKK